MVSAATFSEAVKECDVVGTMRDAAGANLVPASAIFPVDPNHSPIDTYMATRQIPGGQQFVIQSNATAIGSIIGLPFAIPNVGKGFLLDSLAMDITASGTVGNRFYTVYLTDSIGSQDWAGALSTVVTAGQICGYDISFGNVGPASTVIRKRLAALTSTNVQVREYCPIRALESRAQIILGGFNAAGPVNIIAVDTAAIDAADSMLFRVTGRIYDA